MDKKIIKQLNQLNKNFYQTITKSFNQTRQYFWAGWQQLIPFIQNLINDQGQTIKILDLGCGNARFLEFLITHFPHLKYNYYGLDSSQELLNIAQKKHWPNNVETNFKHVDIVRKIIKEQELINNKYHLIVAFGLMHHIPSFNLRKKIINHIDQNLKIDGLSVLSFWQFASDKRYQQRFIDSQKINIAAEQLEKNDYLLDWQKGKRALRFCHWVNEIELSQLTENINSKTLKTFYADGKSGKLNYYWVGEK